MSDDEITKEPSEVNSFSIQFQSKDPLYCVQCDTALSCFPMKRRIEKSTARMWIGCPDCGVGFRILYTNSHARCLNDFTSNPFPTNKGKGGRKNRKKPRKPLDGESV